MIRRCKICNKEFKAINAYKGYSFYCGRECFGKSRRGISTWGKGKKAIEDERIKRFTDAGHRAKKPPVWNKGLRYGKSNWLRLENANLYRNIHKRITRKFGKTNLCELCKRIDLKIYHWANKSGKYLETRNDWLRLCPKCHMNLDKPNLQAIEILK